MRTAIDALATAMRTGVRRDAFRSWALMFATLIPLVLWAPPLASQAPPLTEILVVPFMRGTPITVNGVAYQETTTIYVNPANVLSISGPWIYDRADGYRFRLRKIVVQRGAPGNSIEDKYAANALELPDAFGISAIRFDTDVEPRVVINVSGPGSVVWDPPAPPEGYVGLGSNITLTPVPNPNAYFAGWDDPWGAYDGPIYLSMIMMPQTLRAHFRQKITPPPVLSTDIPFPELRMRSSNYQLEGQVTVQASAPVRVRSVSTSCEPPNLFLNTSFSSPDTPFVFRASLGPEHNATKEGVYTCTTVFTRYDGGPPFSIPIQVRIGEVGQETPPLVSVNGASFVKMPLAPGSIFSLFGEGMGSATAHAESLPLPQSLGGVRVRIRSGSGDYDAPLFFASPNQINFLVPLNLPTGDGTLEVLRAGSDSISVPVRTEWQGPGLFAANSKGSGPPAGYYIRVREGEQARGEFVNCPEGEECVSIPIESPNPSEEVFLVLFGTGFRNAPNVRPVVHMGDLVVEADYFGSHRDFAGLDQINVKVPRELIGKGAQPVFVTHHGKTSNTLTIDF